MAVLEPMVLGRPVVATRMGGIPEQIRATASTACWSRPGTSWQLAAALRVLADDPALADRLGAGPPELAP